MGLFVAMLFSSLFLTSLATVTKLIIAKPLDIETLSSKSLPVYTDGGPRFRNAKSGNRNTDDSSGINYRQVTKGAKMHYPKFATADNEMVYKSMVNSQTNGGEYVVFGGKSNRKTVKGQSQGRPRSRGSQLKNQDEVAIIAIPIKIESRGIKGIMNGKSVQTLMNGIHSYDPSGAMSNYRSMKGGSGGQYETEDTESSGYDDGGKSGRMSHSMFEEIQGSSPNVFEIDKDSSARGYEVVKVVKAPSHSQTSGGYQVVREVKEPVIQVVKEIVKEPAPQVTYQVVKEVVKQPSIQLVRGGGQQIIYETGSRGGGGGMVKYQLVNSDGSDVSKEFDGNVPTTVIGKGKSNSEKNSKHSDQDDDKSNFNNNNANNQMNGMMFNPMFNPMMNPYMMAMRNPNMMAAMMGPMRVHNNNKMMGGPPNMQMMNMMKMQAMMMRMRQMQAMQQRQQQQQQQQKGGSSQNMMNMMNMMNMRGMRVPSANNMMMMMMNMRPSSGFQRRPSMSASPYGNAMRTSASMMARSPLISPLMNLMKPGGMIPSLPFKIPTFAALNPNPKRLAAALLGAMIR